MTKQKESINRAKSCEFIAKLMDMMEKFPQYLKWTQKGDEFIIYQPSQVQNFILPAYFRHNKFPSFIRQLNMYGFCKKQKSDFFLRFSHKIFRKGNQSQFSTIRRKSKRKTQSKQFVFEQQKRQELTQHIRQYFTLTDKQKQTMISLFQYKNNIEDVLISIKQDIEQLEEQVLQDFQKVQQIVKQLKEQFYQKLQQSIHKAKLIDNFIQYQFKIDQNQLKHTDGNNSIQDECSFDNGLKENIQNFAHLQQQRDIYIDERFRFQGNQLSDQY